MNEKLAGGSKREKSACGCVCVRARAFLTSGQKYAAEENFTGILVKYN